MSTPLPGNTLTGAVINASSASDNTIVAGVATQCILVFKIFFVASAATTVTFKDGSTALTGAITLTAGGSFVLDLDSEPWFIATAGNAFVIAQSGTAQLSGRAYYKQR
jgi:hypothetical protein